MIKIKDLEKDFPEKRPILDLKSALGSRKLNVECCGNILAYVQLCYINTLN